MSLSRSVPVIGPLLFLGLAAVALAQEGDKLATPKVEAAPQVVRQVYTIRAGSAKELANTLVAHFKSEPTFLAMPDPGGARLLLSGPRAALDDALAVLREIDRPARTVHVEILLLDLAGKADADASGATREFHDAELSGLAIDVMPRIRDLQRRGTITSARSIALTGLERQMLRSQGQESKPYTVGSGVVGRTGVVSQTISYRDLGTLVQVRPEVTPDGQLALELHLDDSRMGNGESGAGVGADDKGMTNTPEFLTATVDSRLNLRSGQVVLVQSTKTGSKAGWTQKVILVTATVEDAGHKDHR
jgi:hypothetical protein